MSREPEHQDKKTGVEKFQAAIPSLALVMMIAGILFPAIIYATNLKDPTPADLLIGICVSLFASVIFLWILDATDILPFRKEWISKSIYGAAIASVLGSSVVVYKDLIATDKYPMRGKWEISVIDTQKNKSLSQNEILIGFSEISKVYYGFSNWVVNRNDTSAITFVEIKKLSMKDNYILYTFRFQKGREKSFLKKFSLSNDKTRILIQTDATDRYKILISRPND